MHIRARGGNRLILVYKLKFRYVGITILVARVEINTGLYHRHYSMHVGFALLGQLFQVAWSIELHLYVSQPFYVCPIKYIVQLEAYPYIFPRGLSMFQSLKKQNRLTNVLHIAPCQVYLTIYITYIYQPHGQWPPPLATGEYINQKKKRVLSFCKIYSKHHSEIKMQAQNNL